MPTAALINSQPPFPDNVPTCDLSKLSYGRLLASDPAESDKLFQTCKETGFFLLDLQNVAEGESLLKHAASLLRVDQELAALGNLEKSRYASKPPEVTGWTAFGEFQTEHGNTHRCEFYSVSQDEILGTTAWGVNPLLVDRARPLLKAFNVHSYQVANLILAHLDKHLGLGDGTLGALHLTSKPSRSTVRLIHCAPQPAEYRKTSLFGHTDNGSVTVLFNILGGLQILPPGLIDVEQNWRWVRPEPGCAIVNLGDALVQWSGGILHSNKHRIVNPPAAQAKSERYSFAYVLKPNNEAPMRRLVGVDVDPWEDQNAEFTYANWHKIKEAASRKEQKLIRIADSSKAEA